MKISTLFSILFLIIFAKAQEDEMNSDDNLAGNDGLDESGVTLLPIIMDINENEIVDSAEEGEGDLGDGGSDDETMGESALDGTMNDDNASGADNNDGESDTSNNEEKNWHAFAFSRVNCCNLHFTNIPICCQNGGYGTCCYVRDTSYLGRSCCEFNDFWEKVCCDRGGYGSCCSSSSDDDSSDDSDNQTNCCNVPYYLRNACCSNATSFEPCCHIYPTPYQYNYRRQYCCIYSFPYNLACCRAGGYGPCCA